MRKQLMTLLLTAALVALAGCGGPGGTTSSFFTGGSGSSSVVVLAGDQPACDVLSFEVTITGVTLTPQSGGATVSVLSSGQSVTVDFASLMDFSTFLNLANVPADTYTKATLTLSNPQLAVVDFTKNPPVPAALPATLPSLTITADISPALTVPTSGTVGLRLDLNLLASIQTDTQGLVTGKVNPVIQASPAIPTTSNGQGELENLHGLVQSVSTTGSGSFSGSLVVLTAGTGGASRTVNVTGSTEFDGVSGLGALLPTTFVEMDAIVDSAGNIVAKRITAEEQDDVTLQRAGFLGLVTSVTRLATGPVSQFTMVVREEFPDVNASVPLKSSLQVIVQPSTQFGIAAPEANSAQLSFDANTFGLGQEVAVHGNFKPGSQGIPPVLNATSVFLRLQTVVGNFTQLLAVGADGKSGGFTLASCSGVFQGQSLSALTFSGTTFNGVADLNGLTKSPTLFVKGLVFFEPTLTSVGSVALSSPSTVLVAKKVKQLP